MSGNGERKKDNFGEDIIDEEEKSLDEAKKYFKANELSIYTTKLV